MNVARSVLDDIKTKQLEWCGHVQRMEEGRLPKEDMKWSPPGRRKRGRPKFGDSGSTVVKVLCYKSEGRWFDPSWCQWIFSLT